MIDTNSLLDPLSSFKKSPNLLKPTFQQQDTESLHSGFSTNHFNKETKSIFNQKESFEDEDQSMILSFQ